MNTQGNFPPVRKAVIPAAGFGTRFLPFTKAVPKEMIPLVDKPVIQYVIEEAMDAGIKEILIILSSGKEAIERHFDRAHELERRLEHDRKTALLEELRGICPGVKICYTFQSVLNGLGGAVLEAEAFTGGEPFAVLLGDTVMTGDGRRSVTRQLNDVHQLTGGAVTALEEVAESDLHKYGVVGGREIADGIIEVDRMVEKPSPAEAPSRLAVAARYILMPEIYDALRNTPKGHGGEIQLTDAMRSTIGKVPLHGCRIAGKRHDIGNKLSFLKNTVEFGLARPEFHDAFLAYLRKVVEQEKE